MNGTAVSVVAVVLLLAGGVVLESAARRRSDRPTLARTLGALMRTTPGRVAVLVTWAWLGVHFLAR
ncbi:MULTISPECIES: DUF6186 family protein [unclassified Geodermatophilus]